LNGLKQIYTYCKKHWKKGIGGLILFVFIFYIVPDIQWDQIREAIRTVFQHPVFLLSVVLLYAFSFYLKAWAWKLLLPVPVSFFTCLYGLWYSLFFNHVLPIKVGDVVRSYLLYEREEHVSLKQALTTVIFLRLLDLLSLFILVGVGILILAKKVAIIVFLIGTGIGILMLLFSKNIRKWLARFSNLKMFWSIRHAWSIFGLTFFSWICEAGIAFFSIFLVLNEWYPFLSIWVNSFTIIGQLFQITPGGFGNYETVMAFSLSRMGIGWEDAITVGIVSHSIKYVFSFTVGIWGWIRYPLSWKTVHQWIRGRKKS
jgi:glycosyltransferase AglD